jgi:mRNA-degrading endonuclease RelE of RelBE toxin-antitoxin system
VELHAEIAVVYRKMGRYKYKILHRTGSFLGNNNIDDLKKEIIKNSGLQRTISEYRLIYNEKTN